MVYSSTSLKAELVYEVSWFVTYIDSGWKFMLGSYVMFKDTKLLDSIPKQRASTPFGKWRSHVAGKEQRQINFFE